jgi:hypothetical protein
MSKNPNFVREIKVPVKPHIKKVLLAEHGPEPVPASQSNLIGLIASSRISNHQKTTYENRSAYKIFITLKISYRMNKDLMINKKRLACISANLDNLFRIKFLGYLEAQMDMGTGLYKSIGNFVSKYNISEEEFSEEAAVQMYKRSIKHLKKTISA